MNHAGRVNFAKVINGYLADRRGIPDLAIRRLIDHCLPGSNILDKAESGYIGTLTIAQDYQVV
jgi:hypothetical protein